MKNKYFLLVASLISVSAFAQNDRVTLIETFTSSTCPPCNPGNTNLEAVLANGQNDGRQVSIKYQVDWPGAGDPYYTLEGDDRRNVYSISGVPSTHLDGTTQINPSSLTQSNLNTTYAVPARANITGTYQVNEATQTVEVSIDVEMLENTPPGVRLYAAIFEYETFNNVETNGETEFFHVMKKFFEGSGGKVLSPMMAGDIYHYEASYTFNGNYRLPADAGDPIDHTIEHSVEEFSDLGVAIWVQTLLNREVYQAAYAVPGQVGMNEEKLAFGTAKIYPNPASDLATIAFQSTENQDVALEVINALGQVVSTESIEDVEIGRITHKINTSGFESGMYTVRISSDNGVISERMVIE